MKTAVDQEQDVAFPAHLARGLALLLQAYTYAEEVSHDFWDFAVEIATLRTAGLNNSDLRWLVCKEFIEHSHEVLPRAQKEREFREAGRLAFTKRSCFVLTAAGVNVVKRGSHTVAAVESVPLRASANNGGANGGLPVPKWDPDRQEFRLGGQLVKEFKLPSPNQETILMAFEEEGWPPRIDDPLPRHSGVDPKRRLHDTIKSLNRTQTRRLVRFMGDGSGEGIRWRLVSPADEDDLLAAEVEQVS